MKGEINKDYYCSADAFEADVNYNNKCRIGVLIGKGDEFCVSCCKCYHRKWPTPEQFKKEYGVDYPDDKAVYVLLHGIKEWAIYDYGTAKRFNEKVEPVICACTPWGRPPHDWRPE